MASKKLSDQDIRYLIEKAESYIELKNFEQALKCLDQVIGGTVPHPHYFKRRAFCHRMLESFNKAIEDFEAAIKLDPDDGVTYWERGACYNDKPYFEGILEEEKKRDLLQKALKDYRSSIERIPTSQEAWLAILDIDLCLFNFDNTISDYAACNPYIQTREYQVIRSWYGCLGLTLAGEAVEQEDEKPLLDQSIRLKWYHWAFFSIDILLKELDRKGYNKEILRKANEIHQRFIDHFDEPHLCFSPATKKKK